MSSSTTTPDPSSLPASDSASISLKTQIIRFILTGAFSAVIDFGLTISFQLVVGWGPFWAKAVGFVCGTLTAYLLNRRWTFQAAPSMKRFIAVAVLYVITFAVQEGMYIGVVKWLPEGRTKFAVLLFSLLSFVVAQGTATVINFIVQRAVIFRFIDQQVTAAQAASAEL